jgi:hypothetical protein
MSTSGYLRSDCVTLEVGCYLKYWTGTSWIDAEDVSGVVDGRFSDGQYCYTVSNGIITAKSLCIFDVTMIVGYTGDDFYVQLWRPDLLASMTINQTITISAASLTVVGYEDSACSVYSSESDFASGDLVIPANDPTTSVNGTFGFNSPPGGTTQYYHFSSTLEVNGILRNNNDVFTIGNGNITIQYTDSAACALYS